MNNKIKFLLVSIILLFSVFFVYNIVQADGVLLSNQGGIELKSEEMYFNGDEESKDNEGKILGAYEVGGPNNLIKFYFFVIFAMLFFLFLFWLVNEKEKEKNI